MFKFANLPVCVNSISGGEKFGDGEDRLDMLMSTRFGVESLEFHDDANRCSAKAKSALVVIFKFVEGHSTT